MFMNDQRLSAIVPPFIFPSYFLSSSSPFPFFSFFFPFHFPIISYSVGWKDPVQLQAFHCAISGHAVLLLWRSLQRTFTTMKNLGYGGGGGGNCVMEGPCAASGFTLRYLQAQCSASVAQPPMKSLSKPFGLGVFEYWETAEEAVAHSRRAYCPHCRGAGWIIRQLRRVHGRDAQPLLARLFGPAPVLPQPPPSSQTPVDITQGAEARRASIFSGEPDTAAQIKYAVTARGYDRTTTGYDRAGHGLREQFDA